MKTKTLSTNYVTNDHFKKAMQTIDKRFDDVDKRFDDVDKRFDDVLNKLDDAMGQFQEMRIEMTVLPHQVTEVRDITEDHEKRLIKLENTSKSI